MEDDIVTIEEVAKYLRVSDRTVYDWAQKGELPAGKIGTVWRFKKSEIERWVNERLTSSVSHKNDVVVQVRNVLSPDRVVFINHSSKHDALIELSGVLASAPQIKNKDELVSEILKREYRTFMDKVKAFDADKLFTIEDKELVNVVKNYINSKGIDNFNLDSVDIQLIGKLS